tara:strand:- start:123 stop:446 length:324 start_codon:yes stop_codon:yes gene_type:complete
LRLSAKDKSTIKSLKLIKTVCDEILKEYEAVVDLAENISLTSGLSGTGGMSGSSYSDPTYKNATDGRRRARKASLKQLQKRVSEATSSIQTAAFHAQRIQSDEPQAW